LQAGLFAITPPYAFYFLYSFLHPAPATVRGSRCYPSRDLNGMAKPLVFFLFFTASLCGFFAPFLPFEAGQE
jgi:quinol-cytochrome oxidoreductase complex cytochrome b subunit